MKTFRTLILLIAVSVTSSCSIKEERSSCPCLLKIYLMGESSASPSDLYSVLVFDKDDMMLETYRDFTFEELCNNISIIPVSKGEKVVSVIKGRIESRVENGDLLIEEGLQSDYICASNASVDCSSEQAELWMRMNKEYACLNLVVKESKDDDFPFSMVIRSKVDGISLFDLSPHKGSFRYSCPSEPQCMNYQTRLPRQLLHGRELELELYHEGELLDTLPLGEYIDKTGYDWSSEELEDIELSIEYAESAIGISIANWDEKWCIDIEI